MKLLVVVEHLEIDEVRLELGVLKRMERLRKV